MAKRSGRRRSRRKATQKKATWSAGASEIIVRLTRESIDAALSRDRMREGIDGYLWLQAHRETCDALFKRRFNRFYRVRRGRDWQTKFYDLFERLKGQAVPFIDVVDALHEGTGRYEVSFASKLVATIDPDLPVIDAHVLRNLKLRLPASGSTDPLARLEAMHRGLVTAYHAFLTTETGQYLVGRFRQVYPHAPITETKMVDLVLWLTRSGVNQRGTDRNASLALMRRSTGPVGLRPARQHMKRIVLIACASKKLGHCAKAEDLYISDLFRKNLAYARLIRPAAIFILSAKYELIQPGDEICPYDVTLKRMSAAQKRSWSDRVFAQLKMRTDVEHDHFVFLAGNEYRKYLVPRLRSVDVPMKGLGIGEQLQYLKNHLA